MNGAISNEQKDYNKDAVIDSFIHEFRTFHLTDSSVEELKGYFQYLLQNKMRHIPYHFLVETDSDSLARSFIRKFIDVLGEIRRKSLQIERFTESTLLATPQFDRYDNCDILVVGPCLTDDKYFPGDDDSSAEKSNKLDYDQRWDIIMNYFDQHPDKSFIMYGQKSIIQQRVRNNSRMYDSFFKNRLSIDNMSNKEIYDAVLKIMRASGINSSLSFRNQLKDYIECVYPEHELKNNDFIENLFEWMVTLSFRNKGYGDSFDSDCIPLYHKSASFEMIDQEFQNLIGLHEVKETFKDIGRLCQSLQYKNNEKPYMHMIFKGNPGTGKTTVAEMMAKLLYSMHVINKDHVEEVMTSDLLGQYLGQTAPKVERILKRAEGGVLLIDEAYLLDPQASDSTNTYREECLGMLIKAMENHTNPVIIFAGYPKEMEALMKSNPGLSSRIGYVLEFKDYEDNELLAIFKSMCDKAGYTCPESTLHAVQRKLTALRYEEHFGNARTVENIFNIAVTEYLRSGETNNLISETCIKIKQQGQSFEELMQQLDQMVGISNAKRTILEQILSNKFSKEHMKDLPSSNNMIFVGNAGTGKTSVAKLFSEMLFSIGAAKSPRAKMITASDLFTHDLSDKIDKICKEAMGGVLFIDEIYLLQRYPQLCAEVVSALLEILEEKRNDIILILAGYEKEMDDFLCVNQGLKSRFPITVHFEDFTENELCEIFTQNCKNGHMVINADGMEQFRHVIRKEMQKNNFGNGRTVRNIYEQAFRRHAVRYYEQKNVRPDIIQAADISGVTEIYSNRRIIGFSATAS